jgi:protein phosphatase
MGAVLAQVGEVSREKARSHSMGHALWNVLGGRSDELAVDVHKLTLQRDDKLLVCTDGLYDMIPDNELESILAANSSAESACHKLVDLANDRGGKDNITLIISHFLAPTAEIPRAFVETEVPIEQLTIPQPTDAADTVIIKKP